MQGETASRPAPPRRAAGRRAEYAEATRQATVDAARTLFARHGFFATRVDDIAVEARVSPATVYSVTRGKHGLLHTLIDNWSTAPEFTAAHADVESLDDPLDVLRRIAAGTRGMRESWGDVIRVALGAAAHDATAAASLAVATQRYRAGLEGAARRLDELGALREGPVDRATDVLWFYFGYASWETLLTDDGWSSDDAERWLVEQARHALLRS